jgi:DNA-binding transcriptional regulator LsrR (DeoR family)
VIGVAGGAVKARAILGALRGRLIKVLITDERAAQDILREEETADQKPGERKDTP